MRVEIERNRCLHCQLEGLAALHPREVSRIGGTGWDTLRLQTGDRPLEPHTLQIAEKGQHIEKRRLAAGVRADQHVEGSKSLRHVAQRPEPEGLDPAHEIAGGFAFRCVHRGLSNELLKVLSSLRLSQVLCESPGCKGVPPLSEGKMPSIPGDRVGRTRAQECTTCFVGSRHNLASPRCMPVAPVPRPTQEGAVIIPASPLVQAAHADCTSRSPRRSPAQLETAGAGSGSRAHSRPGQARSRESRHPAC